ncbi:acyl-ACP--UDP-N-acetylglucosamine O-acyltransferase [Thermodesulfobacteriota bacterium]
MIHETAVIDARAELDSDVAVGPFAVIDRDVRIGAGTVIGSHVTIDRYTQVGRNCEIFHHAAIGAAPQSVKFAGEKTWVIIGDGTVIREFVTINRGTGFGGGVTQIGEGNFLMAYTHIAHDCITGEKAVFANNATLAGHIAVGNHATVGGLVAIHQFVRVGDYAFVGGMSAVVKDIPPYVIAAGDRAKLHGLNRVGLKRHGFAPEVLDALKRTYRIVFRIGLTLNEAIERVKAEVDPVAEVTNFLEFIQSSERGITRGRGSRD